MQVRDLSHIRFEGQTPSRPRPSWARGTYRTITAARHSPEERLDDFISWVLGRAGLDAAAYRPQPLARRLPACLRALKVHSPHAARQLLERKPGLIAEVVSSLLIGVTEFFREPGVFDFLAARVLPALAAGNRRLRIWSAACSTGAELYSMAILLREAGLLERSYLLGTDCRGDAIERAELGLYDPTALKLVPSATRNKYFEQAGQHYRPVEALRRQVRWEVADLLAGVECGPWDIILWRNAAIYLKPCPADTIWRQLASVLAPEGALVTGKADRPPRDAGLTHAARCVYYPGKKVSQSV
jgi:chemotaxis methyl-accepting protein methylase